MQTSMQALPVPLTALFPAGGNSYTVLLATVHPMPPHYDETLSTAQFANRCRNVKNIVCTGFHSSPSFPPSPSPPAPSPQPRVNYAEDEAAGKRVKRLLRELQQLRSQLSAADAQTRGAVAAVMADLGVPGEPQPDGTFRLPDGFVLGARGHGQGGEGDDSGAGAGAPHASVDQVLTHVLRAIRHAEGRTAEPSAYDRGDGASPLIQAIQRGRAAHAEGGSAPAVDGGSGGPASSVDSLCAELERERRTSHSLREKLAERNTQVRRLNQRLQSETQRLQAQVAAARHRARDLEQELASSGEAMKSKLELAQSVRGGGGVPRAAHADRALNPSPPPFHLLRPSATPSSCGSWSATAGR